MEKSNEECRREAMAEEINRMLGRADARQTTLAYVFISSLLKGNAGK